MKILLLETSLEEALLAVIENNKLVFEERLLGGPELSKKLGLEIQKIITQLPPPYGHIVVGIGPGSFTGMRVGASMASALAFGWKIPLFTVSSLAGFGPGTVLVDARMGGIYVQTNGEEPRLLSLEEASTVLPDHPALISPHPDKILARIPGLSIEKRKLDPLFLLEYASLASQPIKANY